MIKASHYFCCTLTILICLLTTQIARPQPTLEISTPMSPPTWALLQRELLRANTAACEEFFAKYFDERGYLRCVERWGGDDGPDDAIENCNDWPLLHAIGAPDIVLEMYKKAWEGHLRQYTEAKTTEVPFARDGMYYKEFPVMFDWLHNGEGLTVFNLQGLSDPNDRNFQRRVRRFAGFYMNEDPQALNYDPKHKIIRSMFNGSRGPLLRKATGLDWAGDPIEVKDRFSLGHGEETYEQMIAHFKDYNDIVGDHPQNLAATSLALNAYILTGQEKYRDWLLEYVDAWRQRIIDNNYMIPTNIGLDGTIGGETDGKWYGGVYGWSFSVEVPQDGSIAHRNTHHIGFVGFANAYMLTGDEKYLDPWRQQIRTINEAGREIDGEMMYPHMYGDEGWYHFTPHKYTAKQANLRYLSMSNTIPGWIQSLHQDASAFAETLLRADLAQVRSRVAAMREDETTPDTRLADDPMKFNPASVRSLVHLMLGGIHPEHIGSVLHCRLRYFDPLRRRAGIPTDMAALVQELTSDRTTVTLVNLNQLEPRSVTIQAGGYAEHQFKSVAIDNGQELIMNNDTIELTLQPGTGCQLTFAVKRYANSPVMQFPWDR